MQEVGIGILIIAQAEEFPLFQQPPGNIEAFQGFGPALRSGGDALGGQQIGKYRGVDCVDPPGHGQQNLGDHGVFIPVAQGKLKLCP